MIRCSLCVSWFHVECTGEDTQYQGVWCCNSCRTLPKYVQGITEKIDLLVSSLESIQNTEAALRAEVQLLKAENGNLRSKLSHAEHHKDELAKLIETMSFPASSGSGTSNRHEDSPTLNPYPPSQQHPPPPEPKQPWITVPTANRFELLNNSGVEQQSRPGSQSHTPQRRSNPPSTVTSSAGPCRHENRYWQLHCPGSGTACPQERFWCMWLCFPWPHRPRNQRPHQAYPDDWRHCIGGRHQQNRDSNYCRVLQRSPANHWQCCAQETTQDRDHVPVTPSLW